MKRTPEYYIKGANIELVSLPNPTVVTVDGIKFTIRDIPNTEYRVYTYGTAHDFVLGWFVNKSDNTITSFRCTHHYCARFKQRCLRNETKDLDYRLEMLVDRLTPIINKNEIIGKEAIAITDATSKLKHVVKRGKGYNLVFITVFYTK